MSNAQIWVGFKNAVIYSVVFTVVPSFIFSTILLTEIRSITLITVLNRPTAVEKLVFTVVSVFITLLAAYPMSRADFKGKGFFNTIFVINCRIFQKLCQLRAGRRTLHIRDHAGFRLVLNQDGTKEFGAIIPLEEYIDNYMPNLKSVFDKYPEYRVMCTDVNGHI